MITKFSRIRVVSMLLVLIALLSISACKKDLNNNDDQPNNPAPGTPLLVEGVVTGPNGVPLRNVTVRAGSVTVMTDVNGSFRAADAVFTTAETFVTATFSGYFTGSRTFFPRTNSNNFLRIQLIPRAEAGLINSAGGGVVNVGSASITFPANAFSGTDGSTYTGAVSVKAGYIDPTSAYLNQLMPGDLRGRRTTGELQGLQTFGMMNVELESPAGQRLQLRTGVTAQLTFSIPTSLNSVAPASIPLWHFEDSTGLWKEEGSASKNGNQYVGNVSHFTFWNVDDPFTYAHLEMNIRELNNNPIKNALVVLTSLGDSTSAFDYSDKDGYVDGYVPKNVQIRRDIYNECGVLVSSTIIGPFTADTDLGNILVNYAQLYQTISGTATNCSGLPLTAGHIIISTPGFTVYAPVTNGAFSVSFPSCSPGASATITAVDDVTLQEGSPVTVPLNTTNVAAGNFQACGSSISEFITVTVDGVTRTWTADAPHDILINEDPILNGGFYALYLQSADTVSGGDVAILLNRPENSTIAPFTVQIQAMTIYDPFAAPNMIGDYFLDNSIPTMPEANITQYGAIGQIIAGDFTGRFIQNTQTGVDTVTVTCSFRLRRE